MNLWKTWRDFRNFQRRYLEEPEYQQIREPARAGVIDRPRKKVEERIYTIKQTHEVELTVRVHGQQDLAYWDKAVVVVLETPEGEVIEANDPAIVKIECYREKASEFTRIDAPDRGGSNPPPVRQSQQKQVIVDQGDAVFGNIGIVAKFNGREHVFCIDCEDKVPNDDSIYSWYISQDQTNEVGYYTCCVCKKNFI